MMVRRMILRSALACLLFAGSAFAQVNSSIGGTVQDASQALIAGVSVTAINTHTGVQSSVITNESGAYNIAALAPGIYRVTADLAGFRPHAYSDVQLSAGVPVRLN